MYICHYVVICIQIQHGYGIAILIYKLVRIGQSKVFLFFKQYYMCHYLKIHHIVIFLIKLNFNEVLKEMIRKI